MTLNELVYDSDIGRASSKSWKKSDTSDVTYDSDSDTSSDTITSSEDEYYTNLFRKKNEIETQCFGKRSLILITTDANNNTYGCYFPDRVTTQENYSMCMSMFTITHGIEIVEEKYDFAHVMNCISFPKDCLYSVGDGNQWVYKVVKKRGYEIVWNKKQDVLPVYNRLIMKTNSIKRIVIYTTKEKDTRFNLVKCLCNGKTDNCNNSDSSDNSDICDKIDKEKHNSCFTLPIFNWL